MKKIPKEKIKFMQAAFAEAKNNILSDDGGPFGAVVVYDGKIVSRSSNQVLKTNDPTAHAEIEAIRQASSKLQRFDLSDCEIYTTCEPCPMCLGAILWARIPQVYFASDRNDATKAGFDDSRFYRVINHQPVDHDLQTFRICEKEGAELFDNWLKSSSKKIY